MLRARNPDGAAREQQRKKAQAEADLRDPIKLALGYLCVMAAEPQKFFDWHSGHPGRDIGDGPNAFEFQLVTDKGNCVADIHPRLSLLFFARDRQTPVARVPSEMVLSYVKDKSGHNLFEYLRGGPDLR